MKTICIAGKNDIAVDILMYCQDKYPRNRLLFVPNINETGINSWQKSAKWFAQKKHIEITELKDIYEIEDMLFISTEFDRIIKPARFMTKELYNIHFSMLPKYKGCYTAIMPLLNGEESTGVTLHRIRAGIDTGEIVEQREIKIEVSDTSFDVYKKCLKYGTELIIKNIDKLLSGIVDDFAQDSTKSTYYSKKAIDYSNLSLDVNLTAYQIQNQIRAFCFRPYQLLSWNGVRYVEAVITNEVSYEKSGTVLEDTDIYTKIASIDYDIIMYKDTFCELLEAIKNKENDRAKYLCESQKIIESKDSHGWSALTVAVYNNNFEKLNNPG